MSCCVRHFERLEHEDHNPYLHIGSGAGKVRHHTFAEAMSQSPKRPTASGSAASVSESQYVKDNFVPRFDNTLTGYKEWRKRVVLYARRLAIQGRAKEVGMNVLAILDGPSWTQCEDIDLKELEGENGLDVLLLRLDKQWQYDDRVETSNIFDNVFFKVQRKTGQTLMEYVTEFHQALREVNRLKVTLPDEITGWLLLRRAALTKDQQHLVQTQVGRNLTLTNVEQSMYQVFGQDFKQTYLPNAMKAKGFSKGKGRQQGFHADEDYDDGSEWQEYYETDETYWEENGEYPEHEWHDANEESWDNSYYEAEEDNPDVSLFDVHEFDEAYTAYTDAKQRIQQLRQARGFYPVVALMDNKQMPLAASGTGSPKGKGKKSKKPTEAPLLLRGRVLKLEPKPFWAKMCACAVAKLDIERPTALRHRAPRHRAPARSESLILTPW